jgi:RNA polymerase sigma factor (TIGR02999 family)
MAGQELWGENVYQELRRSARFLCRRERLLLILQPTAVLHEAFLRLRDYTRPATVRDHIRLVQAVMSNVLVDHIRRMRAQRRGGAEAVRVELTDNLAAIDPTDSKVFDLIDRLARISPRRARVFQLREVDGFEVAEVARILDTSPRTVKSECAAARKWLAEQLRPNPT